jgi:hypothetical protein
MTQTPEDRCRPDPDQERSPRPVLAPRALSLQDAARLTLAMKAPGTGLDGAIFGALILTRDNATAARPSHTRIPVN